MATATQNEVAQTIAAQMGGTRRLSAMIGANGFMADVDSLKFSFKGCKRANMFRVTLDAMDTYTVEFFKYSPRKATCDVVKSHEMVYADQLVELFEIFTGLYVSL